MALRVYAEVLNAAPSQESGYSALLFRVFERPNNVPDGITLVYTDYADVRWPEIEQLLETALSSAISQFSEQLA
jgi:hypothetical protein